MKTAFNRLPWVGQVVLSAVPTVEVRPGWLLLTEKPQLVPRAMYPRLFEVFGEFYGKGDGSTTFGLPAPGDCFHMIAGSKRKVGATGGAEEVTLTAAQMPKHKHAVPKVAVATTQAQKALLSATILGISTGDITKPPTTTIDGTTVDTTEAGSGEAHSNMPPFFGLKAYVYAGVPQS